jgi:predicted AAA+ superfamily ATPase
MAKIIERPVYYKKLSKALSRSSVTALLSPRQCGKITLARLFGEDKTPVTLLFPFSPKILAIFNFIISDHSYLLRSHRNAG